MVLVNINYPEKGCSTPCPAMRCQKCIISESKNVLDFLKKDREKNRPDWCPIVAPLNFGKETNPPDPIQNCDIEEYLKERNKEND